MVCDEVVSLNRINVVFAIVASYCVDSVRHCHSCQGSSSFIHRGHKLPLVGLRIKPLDRLEARCVGRATIPSNSIYFIVRPKATSKLIPSVEHRRALVPLQISQIQILHTVLNLPIVATDHEDLIQILDGIPIKYGWKTTLWFSHLDMRQRYPLVSCFIIYLYWINPVALRIFATKDEYCLLQWFAKREAEGNYHCLELGPCYLQAGHLLPFVAVHHVRHALTFEPSDAMRVLDRESFHVGERAVAVAGNHVDVPSHRIRIRAIIVLVVVLLQNIRKLLVACGRMDCCRAQSSFQSSYRRRRWAPDVRWMMRLSKCGSHLSWACGSMQTEVLLISIHLSTFGGFLIDVIQILLNEALVILIWLLHTIAIHGDLSRVLIIQHGVI